MNTLLMNLRHAWKSMLRAPGVTLVIIVLLALGTGGVTAVFNPIYALVLSPPPFPQPDRLMLIGGNIHLFNESYDGFEKREELGRIFSNLTAYAPIVPSTKVLIPGTGKIKEVHAVDVTEDFFETMGVQPLRGSSFSQNKNNNAGRVVIISNRFWRDELGRTNDAIGKLIEVNSRQVTIVGIMPGKFDFPDSTDIWIHSDGHGWPADTTQFLGRLRPEILPPLAANEIKSMGFKSVATAANFGNTGPVLQPLQILFSGDRVPLLRTLGVTAVLFLLLVCAGVMNLLITQGMRRKSEMAMRLILGATRRNLILQLLVETLPLVIMGGLMGQWLSEVTGAWLTTQFPTLQGGEVAAPVQTAFFVTLVQIGRAHV